MLRLFIAALFLASCSTVKKGGDKSYVYDPGREYTAEELRALSPDIIETSQRDPNEASLEKLFGPGQPPLKKIGIIVFESNLQATRNGLAGEDKIYMTETGKQLMTEQLLGIWDKSFPMVVPEVNYVSTRKLFKAAPIAKTYGLDVEDYVKVKRVGLEPDDIHFMRPGTKTTQLTVMNPRWMRDVSFLLVPATELMAGPKWSEQNKHFVNDLMKANNLDVALIILSEINWTSARVDKHSGENIPEELNVRLKSSILISLSEYQKRLENLKIRSTPKVNIAYRTYEAALKRPISITVSESEQNFATVEKEILGPAFKMYKDLAFLMMEAMAKDLKETHGKN